MQYNEIKAQVSPHQRHLMDLESAKRKKFDRYPQTMKGSSIDLPKTKIRSGKKIGSTPLAPGAF